MNVRFRRRPWGVVASVCFILSACSSTNGLHGGAGGNAGPIPCATDMDGDGYCQDDPSEPQRNDCDDLDPNVHPNAVEALNDIDDNCDKVVDEGLTPACPLTLEAPPSGCEAPKQLVAGPTHACLLTDAGRVLCWGSNHGGVLGTPDVTNSGVLLPVPGVTGASALATAGSAMCALVDANAVCWGGGSAYPFLIALPPATAQIAIGFAPDEAGTLHYSLVALDDAGNSQSRPFFSADRRAPSFTMFTPGIRQLVAGGGPVCTISATGVLSCPNATGTVTIASNVDLAVMETTTSTGGRPALCYKSNGNLYCGGIAGAGTLIAGNGAAVRVAVNGAGGCALDATGKLACWGSQFGVSQVVKSVTDATALALGSKFGCVLRQSGNVGCWGYDDGGTVPADDRGMSTGIAEPVAPFGARTVNFPPLVLLGNKPLGACDSIADLSRLANGSIHGFLSGCVAHCASMLDPTSCLMTCAQNPGLSPACFGCYLSLAQCEGPLCYEPFNACAGYAVDFLGAVYSDPRPSCRGAQCLRGKLVGEECANHADCATGTCSTLDHSGGLKVCVAHSGTRCHTDSAYCRCEQSKTNLLPDDSCVAR